MCVFHDDLAAWILFVEYISVIAMRYIQQLKKSQLLLICSVLYWDKFTMIFLFLFLFCDLFYSFLKDFVLNWVQAFISSCSACKLCRKNMFSDINCKCGQPSTCMSQCVRKVKPTRSSISHFTYRYFLVHFTWVLWPMMWGKKCLLVIIHINYVKIYWISLHQSKLAVVLRKNPC